MRTKIPTAFEGSWDDLFHLYQAVDWQDSLTVVVPLIIIPNLANDTAKVKLMNLVNGYIIAFHRSLTTADITKIK